MEKNSTADRRSFIKQSFFGSLAFALGTNIVFAENIPKGYVPVGLDPTDPFSINDKHPAMIKLNERPWNIESPAHLLDDDITPAKKMFVRNNGLIPENINASKWTLTIDGEAVKKKLTFSLAELKRNFQIHTYQLVIECGGNGRYGFYPVTGGNQWKEGAVSCAQWTGVRLRDLLQTAGLKENAVYIGYYGSDVHLSGDPEKDVISRGVPISKAMEDETLVAFAMNGKDIPLAHGYPLRLVIGGWPGSVSGKWVQRIAVRDKVHDGAKMTESYRVPIHPVEPGSKLSEENSRIIESMPVRSVITYPKTGAIIDKGKVLSLRGHAWAGDLTVAEMFVSIDFGATWQQCNVKSPANRLAWQRWNADVEFKQPGYYEVWARAVDSEGKSQPMVIPAWNPKGYLNNSCHRIAIKVV